MECTSHQTRQRARNRSSGSCSSSSLFTRCVACKIPKATAADALSIIARPSLRPADTFLRVPPAQVLAWEQIVTFHEELLRWRQLLIDRKVVPVNVCLLVGRYAVWANAICSGIFFFNKPSSCQAVYSLIFVTYFIVWVGHSCLRKDRDLCIAISALELTRASSSHPILQLTTALIFVFRVLALWNYDRVVTSALYGFTAIVAALWMASIGGFYGTELPEALKKPNMPICIHRPFSTLARHGLRSSWSIRHHHFRADALPSHHESQV